MKQQRRRQPKRNPVLTPEDRRALETAKRLSQQFHGTPSEVYELSARERRPLPRFVAAMGRLAEVVYEPEQGTRSQFRYRHRSGDRGPLAPSSQKKPILAIDPRTKRPAIVLDRSPIKLDPRRGLEG